jgi:hypothetical protein
MSGVGKERPIGISLVTRPFEFYHVHSASLFSLTCIYGQGGAPPEGRMLAKLVHQGLERREELLLSCCCHSAVITTYAGRSVLSLVQQRTNGDGAQLKSQNRRLRTF